jgi:hypothetical protein
VGVSRRKPQIGFSGISGISGILISGTESGLSFQPPSRQRRRHGTVGAGYHPELLSFLLDFSMNGLGRHQTPFAIGANMIDPSVR